MPLFRRLPKRGFSNSAFASHYSLVNLAQLQHRFEDGASVDPATLAAKNLIPGPQRPVKILGSGTLGKKLAVSAHRFSKSAAEKIAVAGGQTIQLKG